MKLYEFQAKELLARFGINVPRGYVAATAAEAEEAAHKLGGDAFFVKAQIRVGDRNKHGGIRFASRPSAVKTEAAALIGKPLVASQALPDAETVERIYVEEALREYEEIYAAVVLDSATGRPLLLASRHGGGDIELMSRRQPELIQTLPLSIEGEEAHGEFADLAQRIGMTGPLAAPALALFRILARAFVALDAKLLEVNPVAIVDGTRLVALDAKLDVDDNALFRHEDLRALRQTTLRADDDVIALEAQRYQINYMRMNGDIGVVVNGAGLALATLDMLADCGGRPANFMDIRTTARSLDIAYGVGLVLKNPQVRAILVNAHGGGMQRCDTIAEGMGIAYRRASSATPIAIYMAGNNAGLGRKLLANCGVRCVYGDDSIAAVRKAIDLARTGGSR